MRTQRLRFIADFAVTVALGVAAVLVVWRTVLTSPPGPDPPGSEPVEDVRAEKLSTPIADTRIKGNSSASVVLVEFSDFECPFCEKYSQEVFELIDRDFVATGRLRYAFRHFPLENAHPNAIAAAEAAECASRQGRFWEMRRLLFAKRKDLAQRFWRTDAVSIGLDATMFAGCLDGSAVARVRADMAEGRRLGLNSTPSFVIGVAQSDGSVLIATKIRGAQPYEIFKKAIERSS
jgi:protein-disulfide isomerase